MKNKIFEAKLWVVFWLIAGVCNYLIYMEVFANVNKLSYPWLLNTIFCFCMFIISGVELVILRNKDEK